MIDSAIPGVTKETPHAERKSCSRRRKRSHADRACPSAIKCWEQHVACCLEEKKQAILDLHLCENRIKAKFRIKLSFGLYHLKSYSFRSLSWKYELVSSYALMDTGWYKLITSPRFFLSKLQHLTTNLVSHVWAYPPRQHSTTNKLAFTTYDLLSSLRKKDTHITFLEWSPPSEILSDIYSIIFPDILTLYLAFYKTMNLSMWTTWFKTRKAGLTNDGPQVRLRGLMIWYKFRGLEIQNSKFTFGARRLCRSTVHAMHFCITRANYSSDRWFYPWLSKNLEWSTLFLHRSIMFRHYSLAMLQNHLQNDWLESLPRNHRILNVQSSEHPISLSWHCLGQVCEWDTPKLLF